MGSLILEDFKIGLDRRRMNETSIPGSLVVCENAHITRGGEIEKAEAFSRILNLPAGTFGLKAIRNKFLVFGSADISPIIQTNPLVKYQRLNPTGGVNSWGSFKISGPVVGDTFTSILVGAVEILGATTTCPATVTDWLEDIATAINAYSGTSGFGAFIRDDTVFVYATAVGTTHNAATWTHTKTGTVTVTSPVAFSGGAAATNPAMTKVHKAETFNGLPYVVAEYDDGIIRHWYNGVLVADMFSGKARSRFTISTAANMGAVRATGSFILVGIVDGCSVSSITVDSVELLTSTITYDADVDILGFENKLIEDINENSNVSGFSASLISGNKIILTSEIAGTGPNTDVVAVTAAGGLSIQNIENMSGGVNAKAITAVNVNSVNILSSSVSWSGSDKETADAVVESINDNTSVSGYSAYADGTTVVVRRSTVGTSVNGHAFAVVADTGITITDASATMNGGSVFDTIVEPGRFVKTYNTKMYSLSGGTLDYSSVGTPDKYASGIGFGFDNLSSSASGSENLQAMATYFNYMAILSDKNIAIWLLSVDPAENSPSQVLNNTGTIAPDSVISYGDSDVFYLASSGIRSIRARDSSNAAFVNDVGTAIDSIIQKEVLENSQWAVKAKGIMDPREGRCLMAIKDTIYVFSYFPSGKISAWSTYKPGFDVEGVDFFGSTIVFRSGDVLYQLGESTKTKYNARKVKVITPFLGGKDPSVIKDFTGLDIACQGTWDIYIATDLLRIDEEGFPDEAYYELMGTVTGSTYSEDGGENGHMSFDASSSHISLMFVNRSDGYARIGSVAVHYTDSGEKQ